MRKHLTIGDGIAQDTLESIAGQLAWALEAYEGREDTDSPHYWNGYLSGTIRWALRHIQTAEFVTEEMAKLAKQD